MRSFSFPARVLRAAAILVPLTLLSPLPVAVAQVTAPSPSAGHNKLKYLAQVELVMELALGDRYEAYSAAGDGVEVFYNKFGVELGFEPYDEAYF